MAQPTVANMRAVAQVLVADTSATNPGLATSDWLVLLNDALFSYAAEFPHLLPLTGLLATVAVTAGQSGGTLTLSALAASYRDLTNAFVRGAGYMERSEYTDVLRKIVDSATQGVPTQWAAISTNPGLTTGMTCTLKFWPLADASYSLDFYGSVQPVTLTGDSDYTPFQETEARTIARMAAVEGSRLLGRSSDFTQLVGAPLPEQIRDKMGIQLIEARPRPYPGKSLV